MSTLIRFEHDRVRITPTPTPDSLGADEAERLMALAEARPGLCRRGYQHLVFAQYCGLVQLGDRTLEILPKVLRGTDAVQRGRGLLLRMLRTVHELPRQSLPTIGQALEREPLIDVFALSFFEEVLRLVKSGLFRSYVGHSENLALVRGRLDITRHLRVNGARQDRAWCVYDELTEDVPHNRVLMLALMTVRPWLTSMAALRQWRELMAAFDGIAPAGRDELARLRLDRTSRRYRGALQWARWIIQMLSPALRAGESEAPALLFDMNRLFEGYVTSCFIRQAPMGWSVQRQNQENHLAYAIGTRGEHVDYRMRPDLLVSDGRRIALVADTKWKLLEFGAKGAARPAIADMYQMNAYASAFGECREFALIYPYVGDMDATWADQATTYRLRGKEGAQRVHVVAVDLNEDRLRVGAGHAGETLAALCG